MRNSPETRPSTDRRRVAARRTEKRKKRSPSHSTFAMRMSPELLEILTEIGDGRDRSASDGARDALRWYRRFYKHIDEEIERVQTAILVRLEEIAGDDQLKEWRALFRLMASDPKNELHFLRFLRDALVYFAEACHRREHRCLKMREEQPGQIYAPIDSVIEIGKWLKARREKGFTDPPFAPEDSHTARTVKARKGLRRIK